jgi:hypothetical protein
MEHQNSGRFGTITILEPSGSGYNLDSAVKDWRDVVENGGEGAWGNVEEPERSLRPQGIAKFAMSRFSTGQQQDGHRNLC